MPVSCEINFDQNENAVFFAGQLLSGSVQISLTNTKRLRAIRLEIIGCADCLWSESDSPRSSDSIWYRGHEDYIKTGTYLVSNCVVESGFDLQPGTHKYSFACELPEGLPTSFEGANGHIRYTMRVTLERPWKFNHTYLVGFTVIQQLDLNQSPSELRIPTQIEFTKHFCCGPCRSAPLSMVASIPQTGYVPGQTIRVSASVVNNSRLSINCVKFTLCTVATCHSTTPTRKTKDEVIEIQGKLESGVPPMSDGTFAVVLLVPPVPPSDGVLSQVITIKYVVKIEAKTSGPHVNPILVIPITIGTVPLGRKERPDLQLPLPLVAHHHGMPPILTPTSDGEFENKLSTMIIGGATAFPWTVLDTDPPLYKETLGDNCCVLLGIDDAHAIDQHKFSPRYPVYSFQKDEDQDNASNRT